jgi:hypothetical protein
MTKEEVLVLSNRLPNRILKGALGAFLSLALAACSENLTGSLGCPELCQDQSALLRDTTLTGVLVVDTVVTGFPLQSTARDFTLLSLGADGDLRVVFRFDTLGVRKSVTRMRAWTVPSRESWILRSVSASTRATASCPRR